ncbi:FAD/NAD-P-binding domain-containing protein [Fomitopsis serialis]|uniref:FAD/NAD-P-binding domain-containing protein n=1 Tax=Fomitopsis serialis TaxID=139415 RepID=UPI002008A57A|nr:FAD/NAD-P-binding domain-containing protein [Neoantrodia serialis]KAH9930064.1 FAD/NAD-P-binding domain-containing protein [Neoantrodia serialis]
MSDKIPAVPQKASLQIRFVVVGGGIAALASAIGLARAGHEVTVLEKSDGHTNRGEHGLRIPPNMSKILYHWGLRQQLLDVALVSRALLFSRLESEELLGTQVWDYELLKETRGDFLLLTHIDLHRLLSETAVAHGVNIRYNAEVVTIVPDLGEVRLASGDTHSADVIVGADGVKGISRDSLVGQHDRGAPVGISIINATFDTKTAVGQLPEELERAADFESNMIFAAFGNKCGALAFPINQWRECTFQFLVQDHTTEGTWGDPPCQDLKTLVPNPCDPRLRFVADNASNAVRVVLKDYSHLENWVHDSSRLVVIGEAAHTFPAIAVQGPAMAVEDAAVLGKLFSHLSSRDQIPSFLWAFQDIRQRRCTAIQQVEHGNVYYMTMADSPEQRARDEALKAKHRAGKNVMAPEDGEESAQWGEVRETFGYDCEDEADNWWVQWGLLRERAKGAQQSQARDFAFTWGNMGVSVSQNEDANSE